MSRDVSDRRWRELSEADRAQLYRGIGHLQIGARARARKEYAAGHAEVIEFPVRRVWNLITCDGPPCCPNTWLIQASADEYVFVESWDHLRAAHDRFPGSRVKATRLPLTGRLLDAEVTGPPVEPEAEVLQGVLLDRATSASECEVLGAEGVARSFRREADE